MALSLFQEGGDEEESVELYKLRDSRTEWEKRRRTKWIWHKLSESLVWADGPQAAVWSL